MERIVEERITVGGKERVGATVTYRNAGEKMPAVVLVMGTGKTDRDGNQKGFRTDFYKNLARFFAERGFLCIRYDKRGTYETGGNYGTAGLIDLTDDAAAVVCHAKKLPQADGERTIVCGHSEGAMIATLLTERVNVAGLILLGGAGMCMKDALFYQNRLAVEELGKKKGPVGFLARKQLTMEKANRQVEALFAKCAAAKKGRVFFNGAFINAKWVKEHGLYSSEDFADKLKAFRKPVLAVTGTADLSADCGRLAVLASEEHVTVYAPERVNHILRAVDDDNSMLTVKKQYKRLAALPMHEETQRVIENWLKRFFP